MNQNQLPETLFGKESVKDLEDVLNEIGLLTGALEGIADRFHSEEYWGTVGHKFMINAAIAEGLQLEILIKRLDQLLTAAHHFNFELKQEGSKRSRGVSAA